MAVSQVSGFLFFTLLSIYLAQESFSGRVSLSLLFQSPEGSLVLLGRIHGSLGF